MPLRQFERPTLTEWRAASHTVASKASEACALFQEYLMQGGPDAIKSLRATVRKLQSQVDETKADARLERFRRLQRDLQEADEVNAALRQLLMDGHGCTDAHIDDVLQLKLFKTSLLYGASRELLLHENRLLRSQLEDRLVTTRTLRDGGGATLLSGSPGKRNWVAKSRANQARMLQGPHMEVIGQLHDAAARLLEAEHKYQLPLMRHAEVQHDDGSRQLIFTLEEQLEAATTEQKRLAQLLEHQEHKSLVLTRKLQQAQEDAAEARRQRDEMLAHSGNIAKDVRDYLRSETQRADAAEVAAGATKAELHAAKEHVQALDRQFHAATAALQALEATLQEKIAQVDMLRGLYVELRDAFGQAEQRASEQQARLGNQIHQSLQQHAQHQQAAMHETASHSRAASDAAQRSAAQSSALLEQQRLLVSEVTKHRDESNRSLRALDDQLRVTREALAASERERRQLQRQAIAALALTRLEDRRLERTTQLLTKDVPNVVVDRLATEFGTLQGIADDARLATEQLNYVIDGGYGGCCDKVEDCEQFNQWEPVDATTSVLLEDSRVLRAQLQALAKDE